MRRGRPAPRSARRVSSPRAGDGEPRPAAPAAATAKVTVVIPNHGRPLARLLRALDVDEVIVIDGLSAAAARNRGSRGPQRARRAARLRHRPAAGLARAAARPLQRPRGGRGRAADRAAQQTGTIGRYEAARRRWTAGLRPRAVVPRGRVPFVPGAALVVRRHLRFDEGLDHGGEDVDLIWRAPYVRYEPARGRARAPDPPAQWLKRRVYYGRTAAPLASAIRSTRGR